MVTKKDNTGFTLIELAIVITIIAIMAAIGAPVISSIMPNIHLKDEARTLYRNMQTARIEAIKNNLNTAIQFDTANNNYVICDNWNIATTACDGATQTVQFVTLLTSKDYKSGVGYGYGAATLQVDNATALPLSPDDSVSYSYSPPATDNVVVFTPQGMGSNGYVYLDHSENTTTYAVGSSTSGVIKLLKWVGGSWQ